MIFRTYRDLLRIVAVRRILVLALLMRIPMWAAGVVLVLHVVDHLGRSYAAAGIVDMVMAICLAISGPWRGRRLDRIGLRGTVAPSLVVLAICWSIAPWVGYWPLVALVGVAGLFVVPTFSIVRQVLIASVPDDRRTAVLSLDSVFVEFSFMLGPVLGVLLATNIPTPIALITMQGCALLGGVALWIMNPRLIHEDEPQDDSVHDRSWLTPWVIGILAICVAATITLSGEDLSTIAALRHMGQTGSIGWVLGLWGASSAIGGIVYGSLTKHPPAWVLMLALALATMPIALAQNQWQFTVLLFLSGFFCAPTITATVDDLSRAVPAQRRGEAMGWHGSALTFGGAASAPAVGWAIDHGGWQTGFLAAGGIGVLAVLVSLVLRQGRQARQVSDVDAESSEDLARGLAAVQRVEVQARGATGE